MPVAWASADVIRPRGAPEIYPAGVPGEESHSGPTLAGPFGPSESMLVPDWLEGFPVLPAPSDLSTRSLDDGSSPVPTTDLARPVVPPGPLLFASSERLAPSRTPRHAEVASDPETGRNVRVPEPASSTLMIAGIGIVIGLAARMRLRRQFHPRTVESIAAA